MLKRDIGWFEITASLMIAFPVFQRQFVQSFIRSG